MYICIYIVYSERVHTECTGVFILPFQVCLIPMSAHGTNAASAQMAGLNVVYIPTDKTGMVSIEKFKEKVKCCGISSLHVACSLGPRLSLLPLHVFIV